MIENCNRLLAPRKLGEMMKAAASAGIAVPAFNVPYLPMVEAIAEALSKHDAFGLIEVARLELVKFEARSISAVAEQYRRFADPRTSSLHLDHVPVIDEDGLRVDWRPLIAEGIACGCGSVMIDGSRLPLAENIRVTAEVVSMAHPEGVLVEAELGSVLGHESGPLPPYEELFASKAGFTVPDEAREFVEKTGVDWLSVSIGSVHGAISGAAKSQAKVQAKLDIEHLRKLRDAAGVPLVLHGGSGIQQSYIDDAIKNGIVKINIGTDIRQPYERKLAETGRVSEAQAAVSAAVSRLVCDVYHVEGSAARLWNLVGGMLAFRRAKPGDGEAVWKVHSTAVREMCRTHYTDEQIKAWVDAFSPAEYEFCINSKEKMLLVAEQDGEIVGYGQLDVEAGQIDALFISPTHAGSGIGSSLLSRLEAAALELGFDTIGLTSALNALGFYERLGYTAQGETLHTFPGGVRVPCIRMTKQLGRANCPEPLRRPKSLP